MGDLWLSEGQSWVQLAELGLAFVLSSLIGLERELRQKSAGLRTHTLVGVGAALFMLVSKYGFFDVLSDGCVVEVHIDARQIGSVTLDGQVGFRLEGGEGIRVTRSHHPSRFLRLRGYDYFATLRSKLQWGSH